MHLCSRHLIGFFLFLALTIYTAMKVPSVVDLHSLQHLPDVLKKADLHKIHSELVACLPSMPHLSDLQRIKDELKTSLASLDMFTSLSHRHLLQLLSYCLPYRFAHANTTNLSLLVNSLFIISNSALKFYTRHILIIVTSLSVQHFPLPQPYILSSICRRISFVLQNTTKALYTLIE